jgi:hypothetical protein
MPAVFALADKVVGQPQTSLFAAFGSIALLVLVEFTGLPKERDLPAAPAAIHTLSGSAQVVAPCGVPKLRSRPQIDHRVARLRVEEVEAARIDGEFRSAADRDVSARTDACTHARPPKSVAVVPRMD